MPRSDPRWESLLETHDSFYIGSDVFYTFLVRNKIWWLRQKQRHPDSFLDDLEVAREKIMQGSFPDYTSEQFVQMLDYLGESPYIVRSSSLLEDNYGNAFAGKYDSVFCVNQGSREERLAELLNAIRRVYASTMSETALRYRHQRGLLDQDEQMALLVMRVSGAAHGKAFYPHVAGVGFSYNPYVWHKEIDPSSGVVRLVFGLGTRAVDRVDDDYTRVVALNAPDKRPEGNFDEICEYSQRRVDYLDLKANRLTNSYFVDLVSDAEDLPVDMFAAPSPAGEASGDSRLSVLTFDTLLSETPFVSDMKDMLSSLEKAYDYPVDIEFTLNVRPGGSYCINLLQCRPLQVQGTGQITLPALEAGESQRIVEARGAGRHIVDMGRNFSGWARLRVAASRGTVIQLRFAETLAADGELDTASTGVFATGVEQTDRYVCKGGGAEIWEPRFTFHGFRYVEVAGWPGALRADDMTGVVVHTDLPTAGSFECSDERLNQLHRMALWTHRSNLHGIPEDCPARERCGWLGDVNMIAEFSMWNFEGRAFWRKYLDDIETTRDIHDGTLCNIAPGRRSCGKARPDWAATLILLPWYLYVQYGDEAALSKHWASMRHLIESFGADARAWILGGGYGDWFDPGAESICSHTDPALTTTFWFYRCAETMSRVAAVLLREAERRRYADWALRIRDAVQAAFYRPAAGSFGSQTADAMALEFGLAPQGEESRVLDALVRDIRGRDIRLNTGVMGVRFLFEALTRRGQGDLALALMRRNGYPSFGDLIQRGATTLWESWGEAEHDRKHGARSLNHPMMAGYDNWFFNTLAGIRPDADAPGFRRFILAPHPVPGLQWVRCRYRCAAGEIVSDWQCDEREFTWRVVAPPGTTALAYPPGTHEPRRLEAGEHRIAKKMRSP